MTKPLKYDDGKAPVARGVFSYFPNAIKAVATVSEYGSRKYSWGGWKAMATDENSVARYADATARHELSAASGERYDPESGMAHLAHRAWNALAELELALNFGMIEDRRGNPIVVPPAAAERADDDGA